MQGTRLSCFHEPPMPHAAGHHSGLGCDDLALCQPWHRRRAPTHLGLGWNDLAAGNHDVLPSPTIISPCCFTPAIVGAQHWQQSEAFRITSCYSVWPDVPRGVGTAKLGTVRLLTPNFGMTQPLHHAAVLVPRKLIAGWPSRSIALPS